MSSTVSTRSRSSSWQEKLQDHCRSAQLHPPIFNIVSDRRGGRTAWSSTVTIPVPQPHAHPSQTQQQTIAARYWYDGQYVHNAKEDAAEMGLRALTGGSPVNAPVSPDWGRGQGSAAMATQAGGQSGQWSGGRY